MYSFDSRVRYSEVDEDRKLSLTGVINSVGGLKHGN